MESACLLLILDDILLLWIPLHIDIKHVGIGVNSDTEFLFSSHI